MSYHRGYPADPLEEAISSARSVRDSEAVRCPPTRAQYVIRLGGKVGGYAVYTEVNPKKTSPEVSPEVSSEPSPSNAKPARPVARDPTRDSLLACMIDVCQQFADVGGIPADVKRDVILGGPRPIRWFSDLVGGLAYLKNEARPAVGDNEDILRMAIPLVRWARGVAPGDVAWQHKVSDLRLACDTVQRDLIMGKQTRVFNLTLDHVLGAQDAAMFRAAYRAAESDERYRRMGEAVHQEPSNDVVHLGVEEVLSEGLRRQQKQMEDLRRMGATFTPADGKPCEKDAPTLADVKRAVYFHGPPVEGDDDTSDEDMPALVESFTDKGEDSPRITDCPDPDEGPVIWVPSPYIGRPPTHTRPIQVVEDTQIQWTSGEDDDDDDDDLASTTEEYETSDDDDDRCDICLLRIPQCNDNAAKNREAARKIAHMMHTDREHADVRYALSKLAEFSEIEPRPKVERAIIIGALDSLARAPLHAWPGLSKATSILIQSVDLKKLEIRKLAYRVIINACDVAIDQAKEAATKK